MRRRRRTRKRRRKTKKKKKKNEEKEKERKKEEEKNSSASSRRRGRRWEEEKRDVYREGEGVGGRGVRVCLRMVITCFEEGYRYSHYISEIQLPVTGYSRLVTPPLYLVFKSGASRDGGAGGLSWYHRVFLDRTHLHKFADSYRRS